MKARDFIENRLQELIENFPQMRVSYKFDILSNSHFIEVLPSKEFRSNSEYSKFETNLIIDFISTYPNEDIVFVTENDLIEVNNPSFIKTGMLYDKESLFWNSKVWSSNSVLSFNLQLKSFPKTNMNSIDLIKASFGMFSTDNIIVSPIKEEPTNVIDCKDFAFAA